MEVTQQLLDYFKGDELAASTWLNKYAQEGEATPDDMHRRMAKEFARIEAKYGGDEYAYCRFSEEEIYKAFKDFKYIIPGGSIMATLGKVNGSLLSNCTVLKAPHDSISGIMDTCKDMSNLFKRRCGVGFDISTLRPKGAKVNNSAKETTGACSFMDLFSFVTNLIAQQGRRGALLLSMNINHPDIVEFITKKQDLTKVTGANISIQVTDEFMQAMLDDEDYYLRWPVETEINPKDYVGVEYNELIEETKDGAIIYVRKVKAKDIWNTFIQCSHRTAEPGIIFKDTMINYAPDGGYEDYKMISTNPCGEIGMNVDTCRLLHLNLTSFVKFPYTKESYIDWENMDKYARMAINLADDLVDLEVEYMDDLINRLDKEKSKDEIKLLNTFRNHAIAGRRTGLGFTGLADMIAMLGLKYDSTEGISVIEDIMQSLFYFELQQDIKLAEVRGEFDVYSPGNEENLWTKFLRNNYTSLYGEMIKKGRRNISFSTVAPTGTVSLMAQCTSGIEPLFKPWYIRRRKCKEGEDYDYVDVVGEKYKEFKVIHEGLKRWMSINNYPMEDLESVYKLSPYYQSCAEDIDPFARVAIQGIIQKYITHSISSTVNLPEETTPNTISDIFIQAWRAGCKGQTVYRTGSRSGVLVDSKTKKPEKMNDTNAPKRPEELEADYYEVKARGEKFIVIVGLFENRPYEIFVFRPTIDVKTANHKGKIIKKGKGKYSFISEHVEINNLLNTNISVEEKAATLYSSMLLRHGISIKYIIKTAKKVDDNITSFSSAMCRVLSKYDNSPTDEKCPECGEPLTRESSCVICKSCGYSKCI